MPVAAIWAIAPGRIHVPAKDKFLKGKLLLDGGGLQGSFFQRTVVLICHHDAEGAFGLVLNRSSDNSFGDMVAADIPDALRQQPLFLGGPVQPTALSYLHTAPVLLGGNVLPDIQLGHSLDSLIEIAESFAPGQSVRVFAGYAGWSPGQLEDEMKRKSWLTHPATADLVFRQDIRSLWRDILLAKGWRHRLLADSPEDPSLN